MFGWYSVFWYSVFCGACLLGYGLLWKTRGRRQPSIRTAEPPLAFLMPHERQRLEALVIAAIQARLSSVSKAPEPFAQQIEPFAQQIESELRNTCPTIMLNADGRQRAARLVATHLVQKLEDRRLVQWGESVGIACPPTIQQAIHRDLGRAGDQPATGRLATAIACIGWAILLGMLTCPPWVERHEHHIYFIGSSVERMVRGEQAIGYVSLPLALRQPDQVTPLPTRNLQRFEKETRGLRVNYRRLVSQYCALLLLVGGMLHVTQRRSRRSGGKPFVRRLRRAAAGTSHPTEPPATASTAKWGPLGSLMNKAGIARM